MHDVEIRTMIRILPIFGVEVKKNMKHDLLTWVLWWTTHDVEISTMIRVLPIFYSISLCFYTQQERLWMKIIPQELTQGRHVH